MGDGLFVGGSFYIVYSVFDVLIKVVSVERAFVEVGGGGLAVVVVVGFY